MPFSAKKFEEQCLNAHNQGRAIYGASPIKFSRRLSKHAAHWAYVLAKYSAVFYRPNNSYGENIYYLKGIKPLEMPGSQPVHYWFEALAKVLTMNDGTLLPIDNLMQLIWQNTIEMGVAVVMKDDEIWVVVNYHPKCIIRDLHPKRLYQIMYERELKNKKQKNSDNKKTTTPKPKPIWKY